MTKGIVLRGIDELITGRARQAGLSVVVSPAFELPFEKTLFVYPGTRVPWDLLPAAWHFLERWDAAVPLWRYGALAQDAGRPPERHATQAIVRDLRVMLHATQLLFVRRNEAGTALVAAWAEELARFEDADDQLAFLRATYRVKPRLCVLPVSWLAEVRQASYQHLRSRPRSLNSGRPLVQVEVEPGRTVKVHAGDEDRAREHFARMKAAREQGQRAPAGRLAVVPAVVESDAQPIDVDNFVEVRMSNKGPLVRVEISPGRYVKMHRQDAIREGLLKAQEPAQNKAQAPAQNKGRTVVDETPITGGDEPLPDDLDISKQPPMPDPFKDIPGVGAATARALVSRGIRTFEQLREIDLDELDYLSAGARNAIRAWRENE